MYNSVIAMVEVSEIRDAKERFDYSILRGGGQIKLSVAIYNLLNVIHKIFIFYNTNMCRMAPVLNVNNVSCPKTTTKKKPHVYKNGGKGWQVWISCKK